FTGRYLISCPSKNVDAIVPPPLVDKHETTCICLEGLKIMQSHNRTIWTSFLNAVLIAILGCTAVWGQATAQISGTVSDQSGAVLPGAEVTATQTETGITRNTVSNETGSYVLSNLTLGPYRVEVSLPGFRTFVQTGVVLQVNSTPVINALLV